MNHIFKVVRSRATGQSTVTSELAKGKAKNTNSKKLLSSTLLVLTMSGASSAWAECNITGSLSGNQTCINDAAVNINANVTSASSGQVISVSNNTGADTLIKVNDTNVLSAAGSTFLLNVNAKNGLKTQFTGNNNFNLNHSAGDTALVISNSVGGALGVGDLEVDISGNFNVSNLSTSASSERDGLEMVSTNNGGWIKLIHTGSGTISAANGNAIFAKAYNLTGGIDINLQGSDTGIILQTTGNSVAGTPSTGGGAYGISAAIRDASNTAGEVHVTTNDKVSILTSGNNSYGIYALSHGGIINIDNAAKITTLGTAAHGIYASNDGSSLTKLVNKGDINVNGANASALRAQNIGNGDVFIDHQAGATINSTGNNSADSAVTRTDAIYAYKPVGSNGNIEIHAEGDINTAGSNRSGGIFGSNRADTGDTKVVASGNIRVMATNDSGAGIQRYSPGISAVVHDNPVKRGNSIIEYSQGTIETHGNLDGYALYGAAFGIESGNIHISNDGGTLITTGNNSHGIRARLQTTTLTSGSNTSTTDNTGSITTSGTRSHAMLADSNLGEITINNTGDLLTNGVGSNGIRAEMTTTQVDGKISINNSGNITTADATPYAGSPSPGVDTYSSKAIFAKFSNGGLSSKGIEINQTRGKILTNSYDASGIRADSDQSSGDIVINVDRTDIEVNGTNADGIFVSNNSGAAASNAVNIAIDVKNTQINVLKASIADGSSNFGIVARQGSGNAAGDITIKTDANSRINIGKGVANPTINSAAIDAQHLQTTATGNIIVENQAIIDSHSANLAGSAIRLLNNGSGNITLANTGEISIDGKDANAISVQTQAGNISINNSGNIISGWGDSAALYTSSTAGNQTVVNSAQVGALNDRAINSTANSGSAIVVDNHGSITGYVTAGLGDTTFTNTGAWNIRNFADTDGDQVRDTLSVAVNDFGASGNNTINNSGVITLLGDNAQAGTLNNTGEYSIGYAANTMALGGPVQGQILGVSTFTNSGVIDLSANSSVGDVLLISGSNTAGTAGGGVYIADGGQIKVDTILNEGGLANSQSDMLVVDGTRLGSGAASILVNNVGGAGANTVDNGIEVVRVLDSASSESGVFKLGARTTAGLYEYDLFKGAVDANAADGNWYLRTLETPEGPAINPESTVYLRNLNAASTMFMHTLHDRLGEPQFTDSYKTDGNNPSSAWVRVVSNHTDSVGGNGQVDLNTDTNLVHLGTDIARWSNDGSDRWIVGVMGAYGQSKIDASAKYFAVTPSGFERNATGKVDGYSVGAYATWYGNKDKPEGAYVDTWAQYGWYDNKVQGNTKAEESYNSSGWTASVEAGYALIARDEGNNRQWIFEPQVQVAYNNFTSDDHTDASGTRITDNNANGVITRVGARLYGRSTQNDNGIQPFVEANWWYSDAKNSLAFNGVTMSDGTPNSRYEVKAGLQGEVAKNWLMWGHAGVQFGENDFNRYEGVVGIKRIF